MGMSEFYGTPDEAESIATIHRALELGVTLLDTADMYGVGHNEELVGKAIKGHRDRVIIATKFGNVRGSDGSFKGVNGKPEYVRSCCDASLKRLGVDTICQEQPDEQHEQNAEEQEQQLLDDHLPLHALLRLQQKLHRGPMDALEPHPVDQVDNNRRADQQSPREQRPRE